MTEQILFYLFAFIAVISAIMVISAANPVHSVFFLILVFVNTAAILLMLQVEFIAMILLVVYVGAIAVLFLFVVMMLNIRLVELHENVIRYLPIGGLIGIIFFLEIFIIIRKSDIILGNNASILVGPVNWAENLHTLTNIESLGNLIYTHYYLYFLIAGLILLVAMVGAIVLTLQKSSFESIKQNVHDQVSRLSIY
jgi:NADH-quinone oxidoreductase subunit J